MKKLVIVFALLLSSSVFAQKDDLSISAVYGRQGQDVKVTADTFKYDADRDAVGFQVEYAHFVNKFVGIGIEAGATFHNKDVSGTSCGTGCTKNGTSRVAEAYGNYALILQRRKGSVQPFVKGVVGAKRTNFGGITFVNGKGTVGAGNMFVAGAGAGVDIKLKKNLFWRTSLTVTKVINKDISSVDAKVATGISIRL